MESTSGRRRRGDKAGADRGVGRDDGMGTYYLEVISAVVGFQNESVCSGRVVSQTVMRAK